jgi:hypothetical protein
MKIAPAIIGAPRGATASRGRPRTVADTSRHLVDNDGLRHALVELKRRGRGLELPGEQVRPPEGPKRAGVVPVGVEAVVVDVRDVEAMGGLRGGSLPFGISLERPKRQLFRPAVVRQGRQSEHTHDQATKVQAVLPAALSRFSAHVDH